MLKWFCNLGKRIAGISTPLGGISWHPPEATPIAIPKLTNPIYITYEGNESVISFMEVHSGKIVFLNTRIDVSVSIKQQWDWAEQHRLDLESIGDGKFSGMFLPLPNAKGDLIGVSFYFREGHALTHSTGGTGVLTVPITGFFELSRTFHSGPTTAFHFKEVEAPLQERVAFLNRGADDA